MKMKQCSSCSYIGPIYKNVTVDGNRLRLCKPCAMKHNASVSNDTIITKPRTPIKKFSDKRAKRNSAYLIANKAYLSEDANKFCPVMSLMFSKTVPATEVHHTNGRENERLLNREDWLAVSREGHQWIHLNPKLARAKGWLI